MQACRGAWNYQAHGEQACPPGVLRKRGHGFVLGEAVQNDYVRSIAAKHTTTLGLETERYCALGSLIALMSNRFQARPAFASNTDPRGVTNWADECAAIRMRMRRRWCDGGRAQPD